MAVAAAEADPVDIQMDHFLSFIRCQRRMKRTSQRLTAVLRHAGAR